VVIVWWRKWFRQTPTVLVPFVDSFLPTPAWTSTPRQFEPSNASRTPRLELGPLSRSHVLIHPESSHDLPSPNGHSWPTIRMTSMGRPQVLGWKLKYSPTGTTTQLSESFSRTISFPAPGQARAAGRKDHGFRPIQEQRGPRRIESREGWRPRPSLGGLQQARIQ
jgi:hypothetical protein